jgi:hypothetical protein
MSGGGEINIGIRKLEGKNTVHVVCKGDLPGQSEFSRNISESKNWQDLQEIAVCLQGSVHLDKIEHGIVLCFPDEIGR